MVVRRLYSGNVIVNDYLISTFNSGDYVIIDNNIARIKTPDDNWYISTFNSQDYVIIHSGVFILAML
jgi:hydrogenase maturation factor